MATNEEVLERPFQRIGAISNAHVGREFEDAVALFFAAQGIRLSKNFAVLIGHGERKKAHRFDLGGKSPPIVVECKSHRWTAGGNSPSAKLTVWNEAMYYFHLAPAEYRKCLCVLLDRRDRTDLSLGAHYLQNYEHLIPDDVEVWEFDAAAGTASRIN